MICEKGPADAEVVFHGAGKSVLGVGRTLPLTCAGSILPIYRTQTKGIEERLHTQPGIPIGLRLSRFDNGHGMVELPITLQQRLLPGEKFLLMRSPLLAIRLPDKWHPPTTRSSKMRPYK